MFLFCSFNDRRRSRHSRREQNAMPDNWHRVGAPGGAGPYVIGPARPKRQPLVTGDLPWRAADPGFGFANRRRSAGGASRRSTSLFWGTEKGEGRARQPEKSEVAGRRSIAYPAV